MPGAAFLPLSSILFWGKDYETPIAEARSAELYMLPGVHATYRMQPMHSRAANTRNATMRNSTQTPSISQVRIAKFVTYYISKHSSLYRPQDENSDSLGSHPVDC